MVEAPLEHQRRLRPAARRRLSHAHGRDAGAAGAPAAAAPAAAAAAGRPCFGEIGLDDVLRDGAPLGAVLARARRRPRRRSSGLSRGAKNTNQPWSRRSRSVCPARASRPGSEMTCAVPGLARHVAARRCGRARPVPGAVHDQPQAVVERRHASRASSAAAERRRRAAAPAASPLPSSTAVTRCGTTRVPPLATVAIITASDIGVTDDLPLADRHRDGLARRTTSRRSAAASTRSTARCSRPRSAGRCRSCPPGPASRPTCGCVSTPSMLPSV